MQMHRNVAAGHIRDRACHMVRGIKIHLFTKVCPRHYLPLACETLAADRNKLVGGG